MNCYRVLKTYGRDVRREVGGSLVNCCISKIRVKFLDKCQVSSKKFNSMPVFSRAAAVLSSNFISPNYRAEFKQWKIHSNEDKSDENTY
jgi:hypothetical protein